MFCVNCSTGDSIWFYEYPPPPASGAKTAIVLLCSDCAQKNADKYNLMHEVTVVVTEYGAVKCYEKHTVSSDGLKVFDIWSKDYRVDRGIVIATIRTIVNIQPKKR